MDERLAVSLVSLLATASLMVMPTTAPAETPHYTSNGPNLGAEPVTTVGWGAITLKATRSGGPADFITCHTVAAGTAANPGGGDRATDKTPGSGLTQVFAPYDCEQEGICPLELEVALTAESLPWTTRLEISAGIIRQATTGLKVFLECRERVPPHTPVGGVKFVTNPATVCCKSLHPAAKFGTSTVHPGFLEYTNPAAGELEAEGAGEVVSAGVEGELKVLGYDEQELINTKKDPA